MQMHELPKRQGMNEIISKYLHNFLVINSDTHFILAAAYWRQFQSRSSDFRVRNNETVIKINHCHLLHHNVSIKFKN